MAGTSKMAHHPPEPLAFLYLLTAWWADSKSKDTKAASPLKLSGVKHSRIILPHSVTQSNSQCHHKFNEKEGGLRFLV